MSRPFHTLGFSTSWYLQQSKQLHLKGSSCLDRWGFEQPAFLSQKVWWGIDRELRGSANPVSTLMLHFLSFLLLTKCLIHKKVKIRWNEDSKETSAIRTHEVLSEWKTLSCAKKKWIGSPRQQSKFSLQEGVQKRS